MVCKKFWDIFIFLVFHKIDICKVKTCHFILFFSFSLKVFSNILNLNLEFPEEEESLSQDAEAAVRSLLCLDPEKRAGLREIQVCMSVCAGSTFEGRGVRVKSSVWKEGYHSSQLFMVS